MAAKVSAVTVSLLKLGDLVAGVLGVGCDALVGVDGAAFAAAFNAAFGMFFFRSGSFSVV